MISIHALLAESDRQPAVADVRKHCISIHALLAESDDVGNGVHEAAVQISIHALLAESDCAGIFLICRFDTFLSTLSLRRATCVASAMGIPVKFLSTLSLRRATAVDHSDHRIDGFLSTLSLRRATSVGSVINNIINNFYPRSPCGERHNKPTQRAE